MSAITAKASRKMKKYAVLTREPRCFLGSFDFSWEQRKFEEIAVRSSVICSDDTLPRVEYEDIVSGTGRLNKDIYAKQSIKSGIAFHQGDVLYGKLRPYLQNWLLPTFDGLAVGDFWVLQPQNADSSFLYRLIQSRQFDEVANQSTGTKMPRADWKLVSKTVFSIPSNISEQAAIGTYFTALDSLITLHQRECISFTGRADRLILTANKKRTTSSWEQRKLGEMGQTYTGLSGKTKDDFGHGQARFVTYMNVFSNPISNPEMTEPIEIDPKQNEVEVGDVFFTTSSETPEEVGMSSILLEKRGKTYLNSFCFGFRPSEKIDSYYLAYMLRSESTRAKIILLAQGISRYNISKNKVMEIAVSLPSLDEQKMIGQYFSQLDNLITLHQRQHFLHSTPDISLSVRLIHPFYTSSWEQRKAKEICSIGTGKSNTQDQVDDGKYPFYIRSDVPVRSNKYLYDCEAVITIGDGNIGKVFHYVNGKFDLHQRCYKITDFKDIWGKYFFYYFSTKFYDRAMKMTAKATVDSVRLEMISEMDIKKPPQISEQKQIAEFFANLDNLITLHQRKGKAAVSGCSNDANNSKGVCCKARDFGYKCHKKDEPNRFDA